MKRYFQMGSAMIEDLSGKAKWCKADEAEAEIGKYRKLSVKRGDLLMMANDRIKELEVENAFLRKALEKYAARCNWNKVMVYRADDNSHLITEYVSIIGGPVIAQKALK